MRKIYLTSVITAFCIVSYSQNVGIGTNNPQNKLHVAGGFRLDTVANGVDSGVLVHNLNGVIYRKKFTGSSSDVLRGDGTFGPANAGSAGWFLNGNAGINPATQFLGTTDEQPLYFRVNNQPAGFIHHANFNTGFGFQSLLSNTTGTSNTVIGSNAMRQNITGESNTAVGDSAGFSSTNSGFNVLIGKNAGKNSGGGWNTIIGFDAGKTNASFGAVFIGSAAGMKNTTGSNNTFVGDNAGRENTTGRRNSNFGSFAGSSNATGESNSLFGAFAGTFNISGNNNSFYGAFAGRNNISGNSNSFFGESSGMSNTVGHDNSFFGIGTGSNNISGGSNTFLGAGSGGFNTAGSENVFVGSNCGLANSTGSNNTFIGSQGGNNNTTGQYNTVLGYNSGVSGADLTNATAIGAFASVNASNKIRLGNASVTVIEGQVAYTFPSDGRFKTNISETVKGLEFIMKLRPVAYNFQTRRYDEFIKSSSNTEVKFASQNDYSESEKILHNGFIAQEVEMAARLANYSFDGIIAPKNPNETYGLSYSQFVVPLVKAVQEQQKMIEDLNRKIENQQIQIELLIKTINDSKENK